MYYDIVCQHEQICERRLGDGDTQPAQNSLGILSMSPYLGIRSRSVLAFKSWIFIWCKPKQTRWTMTRHWTSEPNPKHVISVYLLKISFILSVDFFLQNIKVSWQRGENNSCTYDYQTEPFSPKLNNSTTITCFYCHRCFYRLVLDIWIISNTWFWG